MPCWHGPTNTDRIQYTLKQKVDGAEKWCSVTDYYTWRSKFTLLLFIFVFASYREGRKCNISAFCSSFTSSRSQCSFCEHGMWSLIILWSDVIWHTFYWDATSLRLSGQAAMCYPVHIGSRYLQNAVASLLNYTASQSIFSNVIAGWSEDAKCHLVNTGELLKRRGTAWIPWHTGGFWNKLAAFPSASSSAFACLRIEDDKLLKGRLDWTD